MDEITNTVIETEEVTPVAEEIVKAGSGKGAAIAAGVGLTVLAGALLCKYVVIPAVAKYKARKQDKRKVYAAAEDSDVSENEVDNDSEENDE